MLQDALDDVGGHFLHDIDCVIEVQLVKDFLELGVRKAADEHFLRVGVELDEHLRRRLLGKKTEQKRDAVLVQVLEKRGDIRRLQVAEQLSQGGVLFSLEKLLDPVQQFLAHFFKSDHTVFLLSQRCIKNLPYPASGDAAMGATIGKHLPLARRFLTVQALASRGGETALDGTLLSMQPVQTLS